MILDPTATQALAETHDTPFRLASLPPGLGGIITAQVFPFHASVKGTPVGAAAYSYEPTAMQALAALHDTANRLLFVAPLGCGVVLTAQALPFQLSASGKPVKLGEPVETVPTATHEFAELHDTPIRTAWLAVASVRPEPSAA